MFLIAICSTFVRFIHFRFGDHYGDYLDATNKVEQIHLINDKSKDTCVYMRSTRWFNLQASEGRRLAVCHTLALLRWHGAQDILRDESDSESLESDSDFAMDSDT